MTNVIGNSIATAVVARLEPRSDIAREPAPLSAVMPQAAIR